MDFNKTAKMYENILIANGVHYSKIVEVQFDLEDKETTLADIAALSSEERERRSICKFYIGFQCAGFCTHEWRMPIYDEQGDETEQDEDCYEWASVRDAVRILFCELLEDSVRPCIEDLVVEQVKDWVVSK